MSTRFFLSVLLAAWMALPSAAAPVKTPHVEAELVARTTSIQPGQPLETALRLKIIDHWHTYWRNPGDSGLPTRIAWVLPAGFSAGPIEWPHPKQLPLGPLMNFGYEGEVLHLVTMQIPTTLAAGEPVVLKAKAEWLVCSDVCIPESADLSLQLPVAATKPIEDTRWAGAFVQARAALPAQIEGWGIKAGIDRKQLVIDVAPPAGGATADGVNFFPLREDVIANAGPQTWRKTEQGYQLSVPLADPPPSTIDRLEGVLVARTGWSGASAPKAIAISAPVTAAAAPPPAQTSANQMSLVVALLFAFAGGLILNLMPCVFPVLGIKVMGFAQHAASAPSLLKKQGFAFLAGVLVSFWLLAALLIGLQSAGQAVGWGFQLQSPLFVTALAILFFLMALNLTGVFEMGLKLQAAAGNAGLHSNRGVLFEAFFSGVLATVVATPCTAPMMGAALGFTLSQPAQISMLVFTAIGVGMALPVLALSLAPRWLKYLPRPGAWMETLKQLLAFPLYATVAWLAWVLGAQQGNDGVAHLLFGLTVIALAAWLYGRWQNSRPIPALAISLLIGVLGAAVAWPEASPSAAQAKTDDWTPFSQQKIAQLRAENKPIFVDFTATWCITCQVNKRVALNQDEVVKRFAEMGVVRMKADWTVKDAEITKALAAFGRNGVPLYVYYPRQGEPRILPEVLTPAIVLEAVRDDGIAKTARN